MTEDYLSFNGVDGATGKYLLPPMALHLFAQAIQGETFQRDQVGELRARCQSALPDYGTVYGRDPEDLSQAGWAIVAAEDTSPGVLEALEPLCTLRRTQATDHFRRCTGAEGYRAGQTKRQFLADFGMASASPANPAKFPYYVLLVGGPEEIPFEFQYQLDVQYAVGRLSFDTVDEYARYAAAVVAAEEQGRVRAPRTNGRVGLFGPQNRADRATKLSSTQLVLPLAGEIAPVEQAAHVDVYAGEQASKERLLELLCGPQAPSLLFTASHGVGFPKGDPRQRGAQGALLCQDWPGPLLWNQPLSEDFYVAADDIVEDALVAPRVIFAFACYGAGTPQTDDYAHLLGAPGVAPSDTPFVSRLPQRLLAHPRGGTLAFVGHVERAWGCSFMSPLAGASRETFWCVLQALLAGWRVGHAMEFFDDKYAALGAELGDTLAAARDFGKILDDAAVAGLWTENNDARSYVVLGDPAVRLAGPTLATTNP